MDNDKETKEIFPLWCCQKCGAEIGIIGRLVEWFEGEPIHNCGPDHGIYAVDREKKFLEDNDFI